ncbi:MAG TPA: substrate-binding domain-containing protein [Caldilineaceae bacterium]|nr:extracellular solute-binding protein [Caldilineaceae bacterium]HRW05037.1 substrate-binding domain-containing protein [Caldilineaceae bacterium]
MSVQHLRFDRGMSRRGFLKLSAGASTVALLAACTPVETTTTESGEAGTGADSAATELVVWYQDWDGANRIMNWVTPEFQKAQPDVSVDLQPIGFGDLLAKMLPSIAAGTEGDVMMMYTDWVVATDISQVFLDITDAAGGSAALEEKMWPAAFQAVEAPGGKVYYLPWLAGIRGATISVNTDQLAEQSIDYLNFSSFEDMVEAGVALTETNDAGKITRSGYSPRSSQYQLLWSLIWQMGGDFFDRESGVWSHSSPEGEAAAQLIYDIYWTQKTCDFELFTSEYEAVSQKLVSIWGDGAWTASVQTDVAEIPVDNIVTPLLANAVEPALYPQHVAGWGLSKRLADNPTKLEAGVDYAMLIVGPDALLQALEFYSGVVPSKDVYNDPRINDVKYGLMSKRVAEGMWPIARYPQDHVAQQTPASDELDRAMRNEISITEALANMDAYLQEQEDQARERLSS